MAQRDTAHPVARRLWSILRDRSDSDRRLVFSALERRLRAGPAAEKQAIAVAALEHWMRVHDTDEAPSRRAWDDFRSSLPEEERPGWPSASFIKNAFGGSWTRAAAAADGRPEVDVGSRSLSAKGSRLRRDEILEAVGEWAKTVPADEPLLQQAFLDWCIEQLGDSASSYTRLPTSVETLVRLCGGWQSVLVAVGEISRWSGLSRQPDARTGVDEEGPPGGDVPDLSAAPRSHPGRYSDQELKDWLLWVSESMTSDRGATLHAAEFDRRRHECMASAASAGQLVRIPSSLTIANRIGHGSFAQAKRAVGLEHRGPGGTGEGSGGPGNGPGFSDDELREAVRTAAQELAARGELKRPNTCDLTDSAYRRWRDWRLAELRASDPKARIPTHMTLRKRLGPKWQDVRRAVEEK